MKINSFHAPFAILGAGTWGTAIAIHLGRKEQNIRLWGRSSELMQRMQRTRINEDYLPGYRLSSTIYCSANLKNTLQDVQDILIAVPSHQFQSLLNQLKTYTQPHSRLLWVAKGIDPHTQLLLSDLVESSLPNLTYAVMGGPSFAQEVAQMQPTVVCIASNDIFFLENLKKRFDTAFFNILPSNDVVGVSIGGAYKNSIAIIIGILEGLGFGSNIQAAFTTYGLHEMQRLIKLFGGHIQTGTHIAGIGDLILTCTNAKSRNRSLGVLIGKTLQIPKDQRLTVLSEGLLNTKSFHLLSQKHTFHLPICQAAHAILFENAPIKETIYELLQFFYQKNTCYPCKDETK